MALHNAFGKDGENAAKEFLIKKGYVIRETNWRCDKLEVDIIAEKNNRIVIVEVKTRATDFVLPTEAITKRKISNLVRAANAYVYSCNLPHEIQFDVITLVGELGNFVIEHIEDAFLPPLKSYK